MTNQQLIDEIKKDHGEISRAYSRASSRDFRSQKALEEVSKKLEAIKSNSGSSSLSSKLADEALEIIKAAR